MTSGYNLDKLWPNLFMCTILYFELHRNNFEQIQNVLNTFNTFCTHLNIQNFERIQLMDSNC